MVDATRFWVHGCEPGREGIGWLAAGTMPNSLYRMPLVYLSLACVFCYTCSFLFVVCCVFVFFFCSHWSLVDIPLISFCGVDHVSDWQPRILLGMVEARSVNVKKTTTEQLRTEKMKIKMPNGWRTIHGRRGKGTAESFSREKLRHAPQKEGG